MIRGLASGPTEWNLRCVPWNQVPARRLKQLKDRSCCAHRFPRWAPSPKVIELTIQGLRNSGLGLAKPGESLPCAVRIPQFLNSTALTPSPPPPDIFGHTFLWSDTKKGPSILVSREPSPSSHQYLSANDLFGGLGPSSALHKRFKSLFVLPFPVFLYDELRGKGLF